jgi:hypothetical protein
VVTRLVLCLSLIWGPLKVQNYKIEHFPFLATVFTGKVYIDPLAHIAHRGKFACCLVQIGKLVTHTEGRM